MKCKSLAENWRDGKYEWLMIKMDISLVNVTKIHSGEGSWNEIKV